MGYADMYETINVKHETINVMGYADMYGATTDTTLLLHTQLFIYIACAAAISAVSVVEL